MLSPIESLVARKLIAGPKYMRSFQVAKPVVARLIDRGLVRRVAPEGMKTKNMIELTEAGARAVGKAGEPQ